MSVKIRIWWCTGENGHNSHSLLSKLLPCLAPKHSPTDTESYLHIQNITREFRMLWDFRGLAPSSAWKSTPMVSGKVTDTVTGLVMVLVRREEKGERGTRWDTFHCSWPPKETATEQHETILIILLCFCCGSLCAHVHIIHTDACGTCLKKTAQIHLVIDQLTNEW